MWIQKELRKPAVDSGLSCVHQKNEAPSTFG